MLPTHSFTAQEATTSWDTLEHGLWSTKLTQDGGGIFTTNSCKDSMAQTGCEDSFGITYTWCTVV